LKPTIALFYLIGVVVFLQLLTGGLLLFGFVDKMAHIGLGYVTLILAIVALVATAVAKPRFRPAISMSAALVVLVVIQGLLGFSFLNTGNSDVIFIHFVNALIIYALAVSMVFTAMRWGKMTAKGPPQPQTTAKS
jgi:heme A synthase